MSKILVEVYVPVIDQTFDVHIPVTCKVHEVETMLAGAFQDLSDGYFVPSPDTVLCDRLSGEELDINQSVLELGLQNGARLMLI